MQMKTKQTNRRRTRESVFTAAAAEVKHILPLVMCAMLLSGCTAGEITADVPTVIDQEDRDGRPGCLIEIPEITGASTDTIMEINAEIRMMSQIMQDTYMEDETMWCEMTAWPTETERYISLTLMIAEYPAYGTCGQLMSWVYDKENDCRMTLDEALAAAGTGMEQITADIGGWCAENAYVMPEELLDGLTFRMTEGDVPQFMMSASIVGEGLAGEVDPWSSFFTWTGGTVEWTYSVPFPPEEITGTYSNPLFCQTFETMGQYDGDAAVISEEEARLLFREIYEIGQQLDAGKTLFFDGSTVEIGGETCICAALGTDDAGEFTAEAYYAASWDSVYVMDSLTGEWLPVGFG